MDLSDNLSIDAGLRFAQHQPTKIEKRTLGAIVGWADKPSMDLSDNLSIDAGLRFAQHQPTKIEKEQL